MIHNFKVKIPPGPNINLQFSNKKQWYVCYTYERYYDSATKQTRSKRTSIGRPCEDDSTMMYPGDNYFKYFADEDGQLENERRERSNTLSVGTFLVLKKIADDTGVYEILKKVLEKDAELFLDLAFYCVVTERNTSSRYGSYTYRHPLMTKGMHRYEDSAISELMRRITEDQKDEFLRLWNEKFSKEENIYISYDSTSKYYAGDLEIAELSTHSKQGLPRPAINYAMAYDQYNCTPLFYDDYSGSVVDVTTLQYMVDTAAGYGYKNESFVLDRGFFSRNNFEYMDDNGYDFVAMVKGYSKLVCDYILSVKGTFERLSENYISKYDAYGVTVSGPLHLSDLPREKERYIHIYYSLPLDQAERTDINKKLTREEKQMDKLIKNRKDVPDNSEYGQHYKLFYGYGEPDKNGETKRWLTTYIKDDHAVNEDTKFCGYFAIVTSKKMTAAQAMEIYKGRDSIEKTFRADKSFLGYNALRVHSEEAMDTKMFIEFVALILRCRMYSALKKKNDEFETRKNYMCVPEAIDALEEIEMTDKGTGGYLLDMEPTRTQKDILSAFTDDPSWIKQASAKLGETMKAAEK